MKKILSLLICLFTVNMYAQSVLRLQHLNVEDGLSQSSVNYIFQDSHGFMWFATGDGLDRYDGKEFIAYKSRFIDTLSSHLKDRVINSHIAEDKNNKLWMSTDAGICFMDYRHNKSGIAINKFGVNNDAVMIGLDGDVVWSVVPQRGFVAIDINNLRCTIYPFTDKWQNDPQTLSAIHNGNITSSGIWIADNTGLLFFDKKTHRDQRILVNGSIKYVNSLHNGQLLLSTVDGIYLYDTNKKSTDFIPIKAPGNNKSIIWKTSTEDPKTHTIYIGANNCGLICKIDPSTHKYEFINFQKNNILYLCIDRSQNLWVGTEGNGIFKLDIKQPNFSCFIPRTSTGVNDSESLMVKSIYCDDSGKIWLGTYNNGLIVYDPVTQKHKNISLPCSAIDQIISAILKDSSGNLIITIGNKILWMDPARWRILQQIQLPISPELSQIHSITEWKKHHYLVATNTVPFSIKYEQDINTATSPHPFKNMANISSSSYGLYKEKNGDIYIAKRNGFVKIRVLQDSVLQEIDKGLDNLPIRHFYKSTTTPVLWVASENGLIAYNEATKKYKIFDESAGLANSFVYAILAANDSFLWISTNHGLSGVKVNYHGGTDITAQFSNYTSKDGLQSNEFNTGAYYQCKDGTMIFGGIAGINWFRPENIIPNPYKAIPAISGVFINDTLLAGDTAIFMKTLSLPYNRSTVSLLFRALEFTNPGENRFAYKLQGLDKDWVYTANDKVRYSNLQPGQYTFLLKVSNNDKVWNDEPLKMQIIILPPYWQTWWFRSLMILIIAVVIYIAIRNYVKQKIRTQMREYEKQQALYIERLRISKDVHDDLGSGLSKISLMADIAQKRIDGNISLGNDIKHISTISKELVDNMRDLIWVLNPENTTLDQLVARIREYCSDYLDNIPINVNLDFPDKVPAIRISRETQRNVFLTLKESVNNCIKHSGASKLEVVINLDDNKMNITISDNGKGFDIAHLKGRGNGLRNMKQRIEQIGGNLLIKSAPNNTTLAITIPFEKLSVQKTTL